MAQLARDLYQTNITEAKDTAISKALDMAEELMVELGVHETIKSLQDLPAQIGALQQAALNIKTRAESFKLSTLAGAKERYDMAVLSASLEAPCDGKNAEARAMQLKAHLAKDEAVRKAQDFLDSQENELRRLQLDAERMETDLDQARNRFRGVLAVAGLLEAVIKATKVS